jgi:hypothetical protein
MMVRIVSHPDQTGWDQIVDDGVIPYAPSVKLVSILGYQRRAYRAALEAAGFEVLCGYAPRIKETAEWPYCLPQRDPTVESVLHELTKDAPGMIRPAPHTIRVLGPYTHQIGLAVWGRPE